jgi:hypothetical protein
MPPKEAAAKAPKRKPEAEAEVEVEDEEGEEVEEVEAGGAAGGKAAAGGGAKPKAAKKAKAEPKPVKPKPPAKPLTAAEAGSVIAKGASMARNAAIAQMLEQVVQKYHDNKEWIKKAAATKAVKAVKALATPIQVARQLSALEGCGKGTIEKVEEFLKENPNASASHVAAQEADEDAYMKELDKEIIVGLLKSGEVTLERVVKQRADISQADLE